MPGLAILHSIDGFRSSKCNPAARFLKYLDNRGLKDTKDQKCMLSLWWRWDGRNRSKGDLTFAAREGLDNLIL